MPTPLNRSPEPRHAVNTLSGGLSAAQRRAIYALLICIAAGQWIGRIFAVNSVDKIAVEVNNSKPDEVAKRLKRTREDWQKLGRKFTEEELQDYVHRVIAIQRPFLSGNDRSRWLTVRALVEGGTYEIDDFFQEPNWDSIDIVRHKNAAGELRFYSSKPPLMATLVAGEYWVLHKLTGWTLGDHPFELGRFMLLTLNVIPFALACWFAALVIDNWGTTDWGRIAAVAALCFATLLTPFVVALNNHLWGAAAAVFTVYNANRFFRGEGNWWNAAGAGFWAAFTVTCELPAACFLAVLGIWMLWRDRRLALLAFTPGALVAAAAFFGTNYLAHGTFRPPYSYGAGDVKPVAAADAAQSGATNSPAATDTSTTPNGENWYDYEYVRKYDGKEVSSYWRKPNNPIDVGEPDIGWYAFHVLIGHHGIWSLSPILLLSLPGFWLLLRDPRLEQRCWSVLILTVSVICLAFYVFWLDARQRNYGGMCCAFRQLLWLHPLWLLVSAPAFDWLSRNRWTRLLVGALFIVSLISASYPTWNPWTHPWIWNWLTYLGWPTMSG